MTVVGRNCRGLLEDLLYALNDASPGIVKISLPRFPPWTDPDNSMPRNDLQLLIENNVKYQQEANEARRKAQGNEACRKEHKARWTKAKATPAIAIAAAGSANDAQAEAVASPGDPSADAALAAAPHRRVHTAGGDGVTHLAFSVLVVAVCPSSKSEGNSTRGQTRDNFL